jgi:hypothetical protein
MKMLEFERLANLKRTGKRARHVRTEISCAGEQFAVKIAREKMAHRMTWLHEKEGKFCAGERSATTIPQKNDGKVEDMVLSKRR